MQIEHISEHATHYANSVGYRGYEYSNFLKSHVDFTKGYIMALEHNKITIEDSDGYSHNVSMNAIELAASDKLQHEEDRKHFTTVLTRKNRLLAEVRDKVAQQEKELMDLQNEVVSLHNKELYRG